MRNSHRKCNIYVTTCLQIFRLLGVLRLLLGTSTSHIFHLFPIRENWSVNHIFMAGRDQTQFNVIQPTFAVSPSISLTLDAISILLHWALPSPCSDPADIFNNRPQMTVAMDQLAVCPLPPVSAASFCSLVWFFLRIFQQWGGGRIMFVVVLLEIPPIVSYNYFPFPCPAKTLTAASHFPFPNCQFSTNSSLFLTLLRKPKRRGCNDKNRQR